MLENVDVYLGKVRETQHKVSSRAKLAAGDIGTVDAVVERCPERPKATRTLLAMGASPATQRTHPLAAASFVPLSFAHRSRWPRPSQRAACADKKTASWEGLQERGKSDQKLFCGTLRTVGSIEHWRTHTGRAIHVICALRVAAQGSRLGPKMLAQSRFACTPRRQRGRGGRRARGGTVHAGNRAPAETAHTEAPPSLPLLLPAGLPGPEDSGPGRAAQGETHGLLHSSRCSLLASVPVRHSSKHTHIQHVGRRRHKHTSAAEAQPQPQPQWEPQWQPFPQPFAFCVA
jgi:hypothetical protein